jgi:hypothetical protein
MEMHRDKELVSRSCSKGGRPNDSEGDKMRKVSERDRGLPLLDIKGINKGQNSSVKLLPSGFATSRAIHHSKKDSDPHGIGKYDKTLQSVSSFMANSKTQRESAGRLTHSQAFNAGTSSKITLSGFRSEKSSFHGELPLSETRSRKISGLSALCTTSKPARLPALDFDGTSIQRNKPKDQKDNQSCMQLIADNADKIEFYEELVDKLERAIKGEDVLAEQSTALAKLEVELRQAEIRKANAEKERSILESVDGMSERSRRKDSRSNEEAQFQKSYQAYKTRLGEVQDQILQINYYRSKIQITEKEIAYLEVAMKRTNLIDQIEDEKKRIQNNLIANRTKEEMLEFQIKAEQDKRSFLLKNLEHLNLLTNIANSQVMQEGSTDLLSGKTSVQQTAIQAITSSTNLPSNSDEGGKKIFINQMVNRGPLTRLAEGGPIEALTPSHMINLAVQSSTGFPGGINNNHIPELKLSKIHSIEIAALKAQPKQNAPFSIQKKPSLHDYLDIMSEKSSPKVKSGIHRNSPEQNKIIGCRQFERVFSARALQVKGKDKASTFAIPCLVPSQAKSETIPSVELNPIYNSSKNPEDNAIQAIGPQLTSNIVEQQSNSKHPINLSTENQGNSEQVSSFNRIPSTVVCINDETKALNQLSGSSNKLPSLGNMDVPGQQKVPTLKSSSSRKTDCSKPQNFAQQLTKFVKLKQQKEVERQSYRISRQEIEQKQDNRRSYNPRKEVEDPRAGIREDLVLRDKLQKMGMSGKFPQPPMQRKTSLVKSHSSESSSDYSKEAIKERSRKELCFIDCKEGGQDHENLSQNNNDKNSASQGPKDRSNKSAKIKPVIRRRSQKRNLNIFITESNRRPSQFSNRKQEIYEELENIDMERKSGSSSASEDFQYPENFE